MTTKLIDVELRATSARRNAKALSKDVKGIGTSADQTTKSFVSLGRESKKTIGNLSAVASAVSSALVTRKILDYADSFTSVQNQIRQTTDSTVQLSEVTELLFDVANRSRSSISATSELYAQLVLSTEALNLTTEEQLRLTETITKSFTASGKTAIESAGAIKQLGQAFAAGALRGDEFNSVAEGAPDIMRALQRSLGKTQGELRDFAATGGITAEILAKALGDSAEVIDKKLSNSVATFAQNMEVANNNIIDFVGSSAQVQEIVGGAGGALVFASEKLDEIANIATLAAAVFAARLIPSITSYTTSIVANTASQLTATKAATGFSAAMGIQAASATRATVASNALTIASRTAGSAMALLGGPVGVAVIAATAITLFYEAAETAEDRSKRLSGEVDGLKNSFLDLNSAQRAVSIAKVNTEFKSLSAQLVIASQRLNAVTETPYYRGQTADVSRLKDEFESLSNQLDVLSVKRSALFESGLPSSNEFKGVEDETVEPGGDDKANARLEALKANLALETQALQNENAIRAGIREGAINAEIGEEVLRFSNKTASDTARFEAEIAKLTEDEAVKKELRLAFQAQQLEEARIFEGNLTDINKEESDKRQQKNKQEQAERERAASSIRGTAINLGASLLKAEISGNAKTEKEKKRARKKAVIIDTAAGIAKTFGDLGYPAGIPAALALAATGIANIATINSASGSPSTGASGASGADASSLTRAASAAPTAPTAQAQQVTSQRVVDLRGLEDGQSVNLNREQLIALLETDDDVIIASNNGQSEASRLGVI